MKKLVLLLGLILICAPVFAQNSAQQEKMKTCNADAAKKELKGDERKAFMKDCLAAKTEAMAEKKCNADAAAKTLKGAERKKFMNECLKS